jgi:adenylate cyclase
MRQPFTRAVDSLGGETADKATLPVKPILESTRGLGWIGFDPDPDGIFRSIRPAAVYAPSGSPEALEIWSLPLALAAVLERRIDVLPRRPAAAWLAVDGRQLPLDEDGRLLVRFHGAEDVYRRFSYVNVFDAALRASRGETPDAPGPTDFRDKIVLVGASAPALLDLRATSVSRGLPGWALHAAALDNVLHGDAIRRPRASTRAGALLGLGVLCGGLVTLAPSLRAGVLAALALAAVYGGAALWAFDARGLWLDMVSPALALGLTCAGASGYGYLTEGRKRRVLRAAFSRHLGSRWSPMR